MLFDVDFAFTVNVRDANLPIATLTDTQTQ